jgi:hypothetical protein
MIGSVKFAIKEKAQFLEVVSMQTMSHGVLLNE